MFHQQVIQVQVGDLVVQHLAQFDLCGGLRHHGRAIEDFFQPGHQLMDGLHRIGPHHHLGAGQAGHHIGSRTAGFRNVVVQPYIIRHVFPQAFHAVEGQAHSIQTAAAGLRFQGRMGSFAMVGQLVFRIGQAFDVRLSGRAPVHHQGHIQFLKGAPFFDHDVFAADVLLPGGAIHRQGKRPVPGRLLDGHRRPQYTGALHLMATAMAHAGQGIIFAQKTQVGSPFPVLPHCFEGRRQAADASRHREPVGFQVIGQQLAGKHFMGSQFRMVENGIAHVPQFFLMGIHTGIGFLNLFFQHFISPLKFYD